MNRKPPAPRSQSVPHRLNDPFWTALHRRTCDRIGLPFARSWLQAHSHLEAGELYGWPVLLLTLEADPPGWATPEILHRHYRDALRLGIKADGPLADLAQSLEVVR